MPYAPIDDIPDIETSGVHIKKLDAAMASVVENVRFALIKPSNLKSHSKDDKELVQLLQDLLLVFLTTHESIRVLLRRAYRRGEYPVVADAVSLVREQVEKIFTIALLLQNPPQWIKIYLRSDYRRHYEEWLLRKEELGHLPRHQNYLHNLYPAFLEQIRTPVASVRVGPEILVSRFAERALKYDWDNPGGPKPAWFTRRMKMRAPKDRRSVNGYLTEYFEFPTPGRAASKITNALRRTFLYRWHKEYKYLCAYTHVALGKISLQTLAELKHRDAAEMAKDVGEKQAERALFTSYAATATACALAIVSVHSDYGAKAELREFWEELAGASLLVSPFWNMYIKRILS